MPGNSSSGSGSLSGRIITDKRLQANVTALKKLMPKFIRDAVNEHAFAIADRAKQNITQGPGGIASSPAIDTGQLRASIKVNTYANGFAKTVGSDVKHAPFIELGTGPRAKFPPLEPIKAWCRRHRIPESAAFLIARKIKERGTPAKPFLFPAYEAERAGFEARLRAAAAMVGRQLA